VYRFGDLDRDDSAIILARWIRIRFGNADPDPDPGGQKRPTKKKKVQVISCGEVLERKKQYQY
jgi:hypothetical protein